MNLYTAKPITYFHMLLFVTFLMYLMFILTSLDPIKTYVTLLPELILVRFAIKCAGPRIWNDLHTDIRNNIANIIVRI